MRRLRLGRFVIPMRLIEDENVKTRADLLKIFAQVVVLDTRPDFAMNGIDYVGECEQFEPASDGMYSIDMPRYEWMMTPDGPRAVRVHGAKGATT